MNDWEPTPRLRWAHKVVHAGNKVHHVTILQQFWVCTNLLMDGVWRNVPTEELPSD